MVYQEPNDAAEGSGKWYRYIRKSPWVTSSTGKYRKINTSYSFIQKHYLDVANCVFSTFYL